MTNKSKSITPKQTTQKVLRSTPTTATFTEEPDGLKPPTFTSSTDEDPLPKSSTPTLTTLANRVVGLVGQCKVWNKMAGSDGDDYDARAMAEAGKAVQEDAAPLVTDLFKEIGRLQTLGLAACLRAEIANEAGINSPAMATAITTLRKRLESIR